MIASAEVVFVSDRRRTELDILPPNKVVLPNSSAYLKRRERNWTFRTIIKLCGPIQEL